MRLRNQPTRPRLGRSLTIFGLAALAASGCRANIRPDAQPAMASLVVRNPSQFDVNVYAVPRADDKPVWLGTVPAAGSRSLAINAGLLQKGENLVVRAHAFGSSRAWTSPAISVDDYGVAVLDLVVDWTGDCSGSFFSAPDRASESAPHAR